MGWVHLRKARCQSKHANQSTPGSKEANRKAPLLLETIGPTISKQIILVVDCPSCPTELLVYSGSLFLQCQWKIAPALAPGTRSGVTGWV